MVHHAVVKNSAFVSNGSQRNDELFCPESFDVIDKDADRRALQYHEHGFGTLPIEMPAKSAILSTQPARQPGLKVQPFFYCIHCTSIKSVNVQVNNGE